RLADRLEQRDLVERCRVATDGRGDELTLTPAGRSLLRKAWKQQRAGIRRLFLDKLSDDQLRALAGGWDSLAAPAAGESCLRGTLLAGRSRARARPSPAAIARPAGARVVPPVRDRIVTSAALRAKVTGVPRPSRGTLRAAPPPAASR